MTASACAQVAVGAAALGVPLARSLAGLALPHLVLGLGLGAADAALVPALLARGGRRAPALAALLQAASAAAYALGPVLGGLLAAAAGFEAALRTAAALNLLYAAFLYTRLRAYPVSEQVRVPARSRTDIIRLSFERRKRDHRNRPLRPDSVRIGRRDRSTP